MVRIFNIVQNKEIISCDYTPENTNFVGHVEINAKTQEISKIVYSDYEYGRKMYVSQVFAKIIELMKMDCKLPKETVSTWY